MKIHPSLKVLPKSILFQRELFVPHFLVQDLNDISFRKLRDSGIKGVVFDKDNTLTVPHKKEIYPTIKDAFEQCKSVYGNQAIIFSNSAGSYQDHPDYKKAAELEQSLAIPVLRHNTKKPDGIEFITKYFNCEPNQLAIIGDRFFTDVLFGNMNGMLTICTRPLVVEPSPVMQKVIDYESHFVFSLINKGLKAPKHSLSNISVKHVNK